MKGINFKMNIKFLMFEFLNSLLFPNIRLRIFFCKFLRRRNRLVTSIFKEPRLINIIIILYYYLGELQRQTAFHLQIFFFHHLPLVKVNDLQLSLLFLDETPVSAFNWASPMPILMNLTKNLQSFLISFRFTLTPLPTPRQKKNNNKNP